MDEKKLIAQWKKDEKAPFEGWDFSYLKKRMIEEKPPWDYVRMAQKLVKKADNVLDMGTGGGEIYKEILSAHKPKKVVATEGYLPNVRLARKNLKSLGIKVMDYSKSGVKNLPFKDGDFDLVMNRHDAYDLKEVYRILRPGGKFLTQQVSTGNTTSIKKIFGVKKKSFRDMKLSIQLPKFKNIGFKVLRKGNFNGYYIFKDIGAVVYYLTAIPWAIKGFSVSTHIKYLMKLQKKLEKEGPIKTELKRFMILAEKMNKK